MTSRCDSMPGMCGRDPMCRDTHCPGRPDLRQQSGGVYVDTALGVEAALPSSFTDRDEIVFAGREPLSGEAKWLIAAVAVTFAVCLALSAWPIH